MKRTRFLVFVLIIGALGLSACGAIAVTPGAGSGTAAALPVAFIGIVDSIVGDQWVISGTTVTVDPDVVQDGPFTVGDQVKVEGIVGTDGSFTVTRVEAPTPQDVSTLSPFGNENTNDANVNDGNGNANFNDNGANTNDDNGSDDNSNDSNTNDDNGGGNSNDDNSNDDNGGNSNDDDDNDDKSGKGGDDDKGSNNNDD